MERLQCQWTLVVLVLLPAVLQVGNAACLRCTESLRQCSSRECFACDHVPASCDVDEDNLNISCTVDTQTCSYKTCEECSHCVLIFSQNTGSWQFFSLCLAHSGCVSIDDPNTICQRRFTQENCYFMNNRQEDFPPSELLCSCYGENCSNPHMSYVYTHPPTTAPPPDMSSAVTIDNLPASSSSSSPLPKTPHGLSSDSHSTAPVYYWIIIVVLVLLVLSGLITLGVVLLIKRRAGVEQQTSRRPRCTNPFSFQNLSGKQIDTTSCATTMSELDETSL